MTTGLTVDLVLPFSWQISPAGACDRQQPTNALVYSIADSCAEVAPRTEPIHKQDGLLRVEAKLNLLLALVTQVVQSRVPGLLPVRLRVSIASLAWPSTQPVTPGTVLSVQLVLDPSLPQPLYLCGVVVPGLTDWVTLQLQHASETDETAWQRWVFRQHRQYVARSRRESPPVS
ncbi:MAG: PilZ domain-containing protein [Gammaproteobacteria bacterium]|nr:PilZ domain-containing protein [Gammaproteobacteria bacterium]